MLGNICLYRSKKKKNRSSLHAIEDKESYHGDQLNFEKEHRLRKFPSLREIGSGMDR